MYCFVSSVRECPVKLIDATTGKLRASYRIVDHRERQIAPHSLAFTYSGERLYCGFEDAIEVFDVGRPGEGERRHTSPSKKSKDGLKGIISALTFAPMNSASDDTLFAAGSLTPIPGNIALFSDAGGEAVMSLGGGPYAGVTQLQFNLYRPHMLYAAYRGNATGLIYSWDLRSRIDAPIVVYDSRPSSASGVGCLTYEPGTGTGRNQKIRFDMDIGSRYIATGNSAGEVLLFDVAKTEAELEARVAMEDMGMGVADSPVERVQPVLRWNGHNDTVASVAFQPWRAELLSVSGSRHFDACEEDDDNDSSSDEDEEMVDNDDGNARTRTVKHRTRRGPTVRDASMKLWSFEPRASVNQAPPPATQASEATSSELLTLQEPEATPGDLPDLRELEEKASPADTAAHDVGVPASPIIVPMSSPRYRDPSMDASAPGDWDFQLGG